MSAGITAKAGIKAEVFGVKIDKTLPTLQLFPKQTFTHSHATQQGLIHAHSHDEVYLVQGWPLDPFMPFALLVLVSGCSTSFIDIEKVHLKILKVEINGNVVDKYGFNLSFASNKASLITIKVSSECASPDTSYYIQFESDIQDGIYLNSSLSLNNGDSSNHFLWISGSVKTSYMKEGFITVIEIPPAGQTAKCLNDIWKANFRAFIRPN